MRYWPTAFMPEEDQGWPHSNCLQMQLLNALKKLFWRSFKWTVRCNKQYFNYGFSGAGQNVALAFTTLKDNVINLQPTIPISLMQKWRGRYNDVSTSSSHWWIRYSFSLRLQDKANLGMPALIKQNSWKWRLKTKSFIWFTFATRRQY